VLPGFHREANGLSKEYAFFCGKTRDVFGVEVYRKSTGVLDCQPARKVDQLPASNIDQGDPLVFG
jgi:hypothetical protein